MKPGIAIIGGLAVALACAVWVTSLRTPAGATGPAAAHTASSAGASSDPRLTVLQGSPEARMFREREAFEATARRFFQDAPKLGEVERTERARALLASIDRYEKAGGLSAGEALMLRSGLIKASVADELRQATQIAELMDRYRMRADQRNAEHLAQQRRDPRFQDYKARERAITAEIMAMREIPGGLSRDEYLRLRLQQERERIYR